MNGWKAVRRGRCAGMDDWKQQYRALHMTPEAAAALVQDGDVLALSSAANWPKAFDRALAERLRAEPLHIELDALFTPETAELLSDQYREQVSYNANFFGGERVLAPQGNVHFVPTNLSETGAWLCARHPRIVVARCTPPDENGWMCRSLWGALLHRDVMEQCGLLLVEINDQLPRFATEGEAHMMLHVSEVDGLWEHRASLMTHTSPAATELDRTIAGYIADLVPDGACVQFGLGGLANAVGECLAYAGKKDLGVQTEVMTTCLVDLLERGVVNNSRKQTFPRRTVGAFYVGDARLWDFAKDNPAFCQKEISWVNAPRNICQNHNVVSINNAMEIDLTGQVNAETAKGRQYSGTGGQLEWVIGSQWSPGGKSILALRSSYRDRAGQLHSKILPQLPAESVVTTPRTWVQYVVTEYGVANLKYKSTRERAEALIAIAHPDFRAELRRQLPL